MSVSTDIIDKWLALTAVRDMFTSAEVQDMLLDLRQSTTIEVFEEPELECLVPG